MTRGKHAPTHRRPRQAPALRALRELPAIVRLTWRPSTRISLVAAPALTAMVVGGSLAFAGADGFAAGGQGRADQVGVRQGAAPITSGAPVLDRSLALSRSGERTATIADRPPVVTAKLWTTAPLSLRLFPTEASKLRGAMPADQQVGITGRRVDGYAEIVVAGDSRWVSADYLSRTRDPANGPLGTTSCPGTSGVESGLTASAVKVYRAVCHAFPQITTYGGYDAHGEHASGKAIDIMTSDAALGDRIASFLREHASQLDLYDVIWHQRIWTPQRGSEGWRAMSDRGSATANHFDHVHVSVN